MNEIHAGLKLLGVPIPLENMGDFMYKYDVDGDMSISPAEFYDVYMDAKKTALQKKMLLVGTLAAVAVITAFLIRPKK